MFPAKWSTRSAQPTRSVLVAVSLAGLALCACAPNPAQAHAPVADGEDRAAADYNVVLACIDTLRADHLGTYGYRTRPTSPALDRLAERSVVFEDVTATAGWTKPSVPSFMTGTFPLEHGVYEGSTQLVAGKTSHVLAPEAFTLAEAFQGEGWATGAFIRNAQLNRGNGFEQGFDTFRDQAGDAREIRWQALDWIDTLDRGQRFFLYVHFLDAHWPYPIPDEAAERFASADDVRDFRGRDWRVLRDAINDGERVPTEAELELLLSLYDAGIRYVDDQLGLLLGGLERRGLSEETIVCVISDHGEEFMEHGRIGHGHGLFEALLRVPWILSVPGGEARRAGGPVSLVDVFPTLTSAAGLAVDLSGLSGIDRLLHPDAAGPLFAEHKERAAYQQSLRSGRDKLVRRFELTRSDASEALRPELGARWEAELTPENTVRSMKLLEDPATDPFEIKDRITGLGDGRFELCGISIAFEPGTAVYGEVAAGAGLEVLADGVAVKVRGSFDPSAPGPVLVAEKIKIYGPEAQLDRELRGPLVRLGGEYPHSDVELGPVRLRLTEATRWDLSLLDDGKPRLSRDELLLIAADPAERERLALELRGLELGEASELDASEVLRLQLDPGDRPRELGDFQRLNEALDRLGEELAAGARHGGTRSLEAEVIEELRELGYVR